MLYLKEINYDDIEKEYRFVRDIPLDENGFTNQWYGCTREDFDEVVRKRIAYAKGEELPEGYVPASLKVMLKNGGRIDHEDETKYYVRIAK